MVAITGKTDLARTCVSVANDPDRRSAYVVKKVLEGVKPADLPVEQPTRILLSVNLKTAKTLGRIVPQNLRMAADELVE